MSRKILNKINDLLGKICIFRHPLPISALFAALWTKDGAKTALGPRAC